MRTSSPRIWIPLMLLAASCGAASAQAVTEYDSVVSRSTTTASKANHIGNEIGGIWRSLDKTLKAPENHAGSKGTTSKGTAQRTPGRSGRRSGSRPPATVREDLARIQPGITYADLVRRYGPPSFEVTAGPGTRTLTYLRKEGSVDLELQDGKVTKVSSDKPREIAAAGSK